MRWLPIVLLLGCAHHPASGSLRARLFLDSCAAGARAAITIVADPNDRADSALVLEIARLRCARAAALLSGLVEGGKTASTPIGAGCTTGASYAFDEYALESETDGRLSDRFVLATRSCVVLMHQRSRGEK